MIDNQLFKAYFKPKKFEYSGRSSIYKYIGINLFKKYLPTTGDLVYRYWGKKHLGFKSIKKYQQLLRFEMLTRKWEFRHLIGMIGFLIIAGAIENHYKLFDYIFVSLLFLLINIYPIALQRHNRIRIINVLNGQNQNTPYE
jgi:hypothetical protein